MIPVNELIRGYNLYKDEYEAKAIEVLRSGWYVLGKEVDSFEKEFAAALGDDCYCAGVDNGLNAIRLGLEAAGIKEGDEIIVQANGYIATMLGIIQAGGKPVFVEPDEYFQLDADRIEAAITDKTRGVCLTHLYGQCTRMDKVLEICKRNNLMLFEDCAQSHFASYKGNNSGLFGDVGFFSFYPTKNLGGYGDGGGVVSRNKEIIDKVKVLRNYGSDVRYHNIEIGVNSRLDEMQAGFLRIKLKHMPELIANRNHIADRYLKGITNPNVTLPKIAEGCNHIWYQFIIRVDDQAEFREFLKENGVNTDISWKVPPYLQPCMVDKYGYKRGMFPITEAICDSIVTLPMMDVMSEEEIDKVIDTINKY
ncbi:DegT/DnrJ/EryC1/StrS family aminotransferase [Butyrivibrio sp. XPD2006]|uniref:DegT/DnrJ/EryC1/StrS family aminotransferase n=1 Tax=Butyrivibrio sp. XPD2006 TaxID=1280668 RepID=UPI0003B44C72|nr:DegT/DnrJ/EryC1/StrS family aminotransferase [Butyrivibrio sp. XPD2006]